MTEINVKTGKQTEAEKLFADLDKPSLHGLSYALRHPDVWPKNFTWDYTRCETCAMGLAHQLWNEIPAHHKSRDHNGGSTKMAKAFAIPFTAAKNIFFGYGGWTPYTPTTTGHLWWKKTTNLSDLENVTPEMVADQIDKYLAKAE